MKPSQIWLRLTAVAACFVAPALPLTIYTLATVWYNPDWQSGYWGPKTATRVYLMMVFGVSMLNAVGFTAALLFTRRLRERDGERLIGLGALVGLLAMGSAYVWATMTGDVLQAAILLIIPATAALWGVAGIWIACRLGRMQRITPGSQCGACGYDLRGIESLACPECGEPIPAERGPVDQRPE